jgi:hypothetical protein
MSRFGLSPGVSFFIREKDIGFDLSAIKGYQRIRTEELILFAKNQLKLQPKDIRSVQVHPVGPYAFIGFCDVERMRDLYDSIKEGINWAGKGEVFPFLCTESYTEVKLKGLEPGTDPLAVSLMMEDYGNVLSCKEYMARIPELNQHEGFPTGDFAIRIQLTEKIPRYLPQAREGNVWLATYEGQDDECWRCWEPGHEKRECRSKPYAPGFMREQRHYRDIHLKNGEGQGRIPPGLVANEVARLENVEQEGDKTGNSSLEESSPPGQVASPDGEKGDGKTGSSPSGESSLPCQVASQGEGVKAGSSPPGESNPPGQVASQGGAEREKLTGSASGEVPPCQVASQVVGDGDEDLDFPPGDTQEMNMAMDDFENDIAFGEGNTQLCLNALDRAEAGTSGIKTRSKITRPRSFSTDEVSPKRLIHKPLGVESDLRKGLTDWKQPMITPQDRLALRNAKKGSS